ncbi:hypothetical protein CEP51_000949 [Fusarium floridanum]|uniref:WSC domain-containing protein n=1 Tax=Fusarium floridanum TaxID=1325733 RepID=A0A428SJY5_9HYPO|nr:hypothetical protein CEP51_000949 [Fusarium floridanum]
MTISVFATGHQHTLSKHYGFASSILAWLRGSKNVTGERTFTGYRIHSEDTIGIDDFSEACQNALTALVRCDDATSEWTRASYHGILPIDVDVDSVCDTGCAQAISDWQSAVDTYCGDSKWANGAPAGVMGSFISYGINETCQTDKKTGKNCNDVILNFSDADTLDKMPNNELCSDCYIGRLKMMQASPYSYYKKELFYQDALKAAVSRCSLSNQATTGQDSPFPSESAEPVFCLSDVKHTIQPGDTCDSLAIKYSVSSAAIFIGNPDILDCNDMVQGVTICLPLQCKTYKLQASDSCISVFASTGLRPADLSFLNPWIHQLCGNIRSAQETLGSVICVTTPGGKYEHDVNNTSSDPAYSEYADKVVAPPKGASLAEKTTEKCGRWYTVQEGDNCAVVLVQHHISVPLFIAANPSVSRDNCTTDLIPGRTYCVGPTKKAFEPQTEIPPHWRFGCYAREADTTNRVVLTLDEVFHVEPMSIIACQSYCLSQSLYAFGLQNGDSCLCDSRLRMDSERIDDSNCNMHCNGNTTNVCGGKDAIEVFGCEELLRVEHASLGCFIKDDNKEVINGITDGDNVSSKEMWVEKCASICTVTMKADFFSLSEGSICTCGNEMVPGATKTSMAECNVGCNGRPSDACGGKGRAEVYTTKSKYVTSK